MTDQPKPTPAQQMLGLLWKHPTPGDIRIDHQQLAEVVTCYLHTNDILGHLRPHDISYPRFLRELHTLLGAITLLTQELPLLESEKIIAIVSQTKTEDQLKFLEDLGEISKAELYQNRLGIIYYFTLHEPGSGDVIKSFLDCEKIKYLELPRMMLAQPNQ